MTNVTLLTKPLSVAVARAKDDVYKVLETLDALEKKPSYDEADRDRLSARMGKLGEDAWFVEHLMDLALEERG